MQSTHAPTAGTEGQPRVLSFVPTSGLAFGKRHEADAYGEILDRLVDDLDDH